MNNEVRQRKVTELNRLLPMVHNTIKKHRQWINCSNEIGQKEENLKELRNDIENINTAISIISKQTTSAESARLELLLLKQRNQNRAESLEKEIVDLKEEEKLLEEEVKFDIDLYYKITSVLATDGGFLKTEEILPKCINEYIYLLVIHDSFYKSFSIERLFINPEVFKKILDKFPKSMDNFVKHLLEGRGSTVEFFDNI